MTCMLSNQVEWTTVPMKEPSDLQFCPTVLYYHMLVTSAMHLWRWLSAIGPHQLGMLVRIRKTGAQARCGCGCISSFWDIGLDSTIYIVNECEHKNCQIGCWLVGIF